MDTLLSLHADDLSSVSAALNDSQIQTISIVDDAIHQNEGFRAALERGNEVLGVMESLGEEVNAISSRVEKSRHDMDVAVMHPVKQYISLARRAAKLDEAVKILETLSQWQELSIAQQEAVKAGNYTKACKCLEDMDYITDMLDNIAENTESVRIIAHIKNECRNRRISLKNTVEALYSRAVLWQGNSLTVLLEIIDGGQRISLESLFDAADAIGLLNSKLRKLAQSLVEAVITPLISEGHAILHCRHITRRESPIVRISCTVEDGNQCPPNLTLLETLLTFLKEHIFKKSAYSEMFGRDLWPLVESEIVIKSLIRNLPDTVSLLSEFKNGLVSDALTCENTAKSLGFALESHGSLHGLVSHVDERFRAHFEDKCRDDARHIAQTKPTQLTRFQGNLMSGDGCDGVIDDIERIPGNDLGVFSIPSTRVSNVAIDFVTFLRGVFDEAFRWKEHDMDIDGLITAVRDALDLFRAIYPLHASLYIAYNDLHFISHHLLTLGLVKNVTSLLNSVDFFHQAGDACLYKAVNDAFDGVYGYFECGFRDAHVAGQAMKINDAINHTNTVLAELEQEWSDVLPSHVYHWCINRVCERLFAGLSSDLLKLLDIGDEESEAMARYLGNLIEIIDKVDHHGKDITERRRLNAIRVILVAKLAVISEGFEDGVWQADGIENTHLSKLIAALFTESEQREALLSRINV